MKFQSIKKKNDNKMSKNPIWTALNSKTLDTAVDFPSLDIENKMRSNK